MDENLRSCVSSLRFVSGWAVKVRDLSSHLAKGRAEPSSVVTYHAHMAPIMLYETTAFAPLVFMQGGRNVV